MDTIILIAIGAVALGYVAYLVWNNMTGKSTCNCGGSCANTACKSKCMVK